MKPEHKPAIRSAIAASYFVQFSAEQVRGILLDVARRACGIPDGADVKIHATDIDPINFSITHDLPHMQISSKEGRRVAESVSGTTEPDFEDVAISQRAGEADGAIVSHGEPDSRAAEIMAAAGELSPVQSHVRGLPVDSLWGLENDIELLERSIEGQNRHQIGDAMGWSETAILKRFSILVGRKGKDPAKFGREEVLAALREMSGTAKQEAAE